MPSMSMLGQACPMRLERHQVAFRPSRGPGRLLAPCQASKGFGTDTPAKQPDGESKPAPVAPDYAIEALESRMRSRRAKQRLEPQVKVESATVDAVQGKTKPTQQQMAEGNYILAMFTLGGVVLLEGLLIAGSGFLPEDWDLFIQDSLYPNYTGTVGLFLAASSLYGLWKTGKVSLPFLGEAPPSQE